MNLIEALESARNGNFVTNRYFSEDQTLHYWNGKFYYEDGAVVTYDFLRRQEFAMNGEWTVCIPVDKVNREKLGKMHRESGSLMLTNGSYMECIIS